MPTEDQSLEEILFDLAVQKATAEERAAFLNHACRGNPGLRAQVEELLEGHFGGAGFLPKAAAGGPVPLTTLVVAPVEASAQMLGRRYKLLEKIGEGGFGEVWMAEQREPIKRRVAIKIIKLGMDSRQVVARFEAERQALAMMDHPNIAKIFDAGTTESPLTPSLSPGGGEGVRRTGEGVLSAGRPYFVMELVRGIKITEYCDQNQLPTQERLRLFILVCQAIQHAHQKGIIHRDIKPSNILVTLHDGVPVPKVIDFGIAKATQQELTDKTVFTQFQQFIGTPAYISPEQAEMSGLDIDTRADIYSLGVLLYELLVGQTPFDAKEMMKGGLDALRQIIREQEPLRPSTRLNTLPGEARTTAGKRRQTEVGKLVHQLQGDLDWIVMKCLEKDRTRRYDTANGLATDIQRHLGNEPVVARPPSAAYKLQKAWQRNKLAFTAGTAVALALVVGIGVSTWQAVVATRAKSVSVQAQAKAEAEQQRADIQAQKASTSEQRARRLLYASDMNLAQQSLTLNNLGKARRLLDRHRPQPGEEDLRGWEWRYLWQQTRSSSLVTLTNGSARGFSTSFSPNGNFLAVAWYDGAVDLWDVPARRRIRALTDGGKLPPGRVVFSPARNLLAATSGHKGVMLYDLDSQQEKLVWKPDDKPLWSVPDMAFSLDGSKLAIYARLLRTNSVPGDAVWVINTASLKIESHYKTLYASLFSFGAVQLSPDGRYLYMARSDFANSRYSIQCVDLTTGRQVWENEPQRDKGLTTLALSADGRLLASGSGYEDPAIRVWDASNGRFLVRLDGHTAWVNELVFGGTGGQLISAAADQTIRFWDTNNWTETRVLRGHADEVQTIAISEAAKLVASASKDGDVILWKEDGAGIGSAYRRLPEALRHKELLPLDHSKALLLHRSKPPELVDLAQDSAPMPFLPLPEIISTNVLGHPGDDNILCDWNGTNEIRVREWREGKFDLLGAVRLDSALRPATCAYNPRRRFLAWTTGGPTSSVYLANITEPGRRIEFKSDLRGLDFLSFTEDGNYLSFGFERDKLMRIWDVETRRTIISLTERVRYWAFAPGNHRVAFALEDGLDHEIRFYDLANPNTILKRYSGKHFPGAQAESNELMAFSSGGGQISLFASATGELIDTVHGHGSSIFGLGFSPDGRRLISSSGGREAVKLWDVSTRQELLTLAGTGSILVRAKFSADGNVILAGAPWQAWTAPSWEEIARTEAKEKTAK